MASVKELEKEVNTLETELDKYDVAANPDGTYTVGGKRLSAKEFGAAKKVAKTNFDRANKKYKQTKKEESTKSKRTDEKVFSLKEELRLLQVENARRAANIAAQKGEGRFDTAQGFIDRNNERIQEITDTLVSLGSPPAGQESATSATESTGPKGFAKQLAEPIGPGIGQPFGDRKTVKPKPAVTPKTTTGGGVKPPAQAGEFPGETKIKGGKTYTWNGTKWVTAGKLNTEQVITKFKQMFPTQAWLTEIDTAKYPQVRQLLERAVVGEMWKTPQGLERFKTEWEATDFFTELKTDNQVKTITSLVGDLGFDTVPFNSFLTKSMNMGWKGETLKAEVYKEVFRKNMDDTYANPTAYARAKKSNEYLSVAKIGKEYFSEVADSDIETVLTGGMLVDDVQRKQRELAKTKYGHLSNLIEQGFTLKQLSDPFRQQASSLLERNIDDIDMGEASFEAAYNYGEPDKKRMMTTGEWEIMLRSDAKYGWDKTNNAKAEARTLASSIAQAFGKVI
jgi:hypothetical protein